MTEREQIQIQIEAGLDRMRDQLGIADRKFPGESILGWVLGSCCVACLFFVFVVKAKAQSPTVQEMVAPPEVFCSDPKKHINNVLKKTGMFKDAFPLSGEPARNVSRNIFNHIPPADHVVIIRQTNGGSIMVPCVWGKNGPEWSGEQSNRVAVDFEFKRDLENPKTEINSPGVDDLPKHKKRTRKAEAK